MTSKSRKWTVDLCSEQRLYMIHSVYPTCISLNMKDQTVRHTRWPEPNRKEEHGSDFEVLRQEMFSGSSVNGSDPADELRILQQEFFLCDSSGAAVLTVFILKQYSYLSKIYSKHEQNRRSFRRLTGCVSVVSGPVLSPHRLVNWIRTHLWHSGAEKVPQPRLHRWTLLSDCLWRRFIY